jgi:hypothetical protein
MRYYTIRVFRQSNPTERSEAIISALGSLALGAADFRLKVQNERKGTPAPVKFWTSAKLETQL